MKPDTSTPHATIREAYGNVATGNPSGVIESCCQPDPAQAVQANGLASCCSPGGGTAAVRLGYSDDDMSAIPEGANLGLGCGNPIAVANLVAGETVVDLGSGAGMDVFLAASQVGPKGLVIGVDMTPQMLDRARHNAASQNIENTSFRLGEIEHLPIADNSVDAIISNCVINLSPNKTQVFREAFRVLKAGGRVAISDVVARGELPEAVHNDTALTVGCMGGASPIDRLKQILTEVGFTQVSITPKDGSGDFIREWAPGTGIEEMVVSAHIQGVKPPH